MNDPEIYLPREIFGSETEIPPRVFVSPPKYVQGPGVLGHIGRYLSIYRLQQVAILASKRGHGAEGATVRKSLNTHGVDCHAVEFAGECSLEEINAKVGSLGDTRLDALVAVGGGKCVDAGKAIAHRLDVPVVIVPTLASNDAPCSALSVLYSPQGVMSAAEFFPHNPIAVVVDTAVVADAPARYLVAGMGDAMATWYEARVCAQNANGRNVLGGRPTLAANAMGEICATTLYTHGERAVEAVRSRNVDDSLERVVEANTLLSGIGFESGGLAIAHGVARGYTTIASVERNYLHGEMVAMGVVTQLVLEGEAAQARKVAEFFARVGLPIHLGQLDLDRSQAARLGTVVDSVTTFPGLDNLSFTLDPGEILAGLLDADALGREVASRAGDVAYRALRAA